MMSNSNAGDLKMNVVAFRRTPAMIQGLVPLVFPAPTNASNGLSI